MLIEASENYRDVAAGFAPTPAIKSRIAYQHTVARELTHKRYLENVYITSLERLDSQEFLAGAYIPRANAFLNAMRGDSNDVTIPIIEIGRQLGMAIAHKFLGVGYGNAFILSDLQFEFCALENTIDWRRNETVLAHSVQTDLERQANGEVSQIGGDISFYADDQCVFRQTSNCAIQDRARYTKLRDIMRTRYERSRRLNNKASYPPSIGFKAALCTKCSALDDTLWIDSGINSFIATLQVDHNNLFFFDHDNDHIPGMLILEGMRQLAVDICTRFGHAHVAQIAQINIDFSTFAELDSPLYLVATVTRKPTDPGALAQISIEARQLDKVASKGVFILR